MLNVTDLKLDIRLSPDPVLKIVCDPIEDFGSQTKKLAESMAQVMYDSGGVGLAAPQVGLTKKMIVVDCDYDGRKNRRPLTLINAEVIEHSDEFYLGPEGCLSIPGVCFMIPRYTWVKVKAQDVKGNYFTIEAQEDLLCRCLQHEIDHTNGIVMFDRLKPAERIGALRQYQEAIAQGARPGDV